MNQLSSAAVGEKLAALLTAEYLQERASRGRRRAFDAVLRKVPKTAPSKEDALPNDGMRVTRSTTAGRRR